MSVPYLMNLFSKAQSSREPSRLMSGEAHRASKAQTQLQEDRVYDQDHQFIHVSMKSV